MSVNIHSPFGHLFSCLFFLLQQLRRQLVESQDSATALEKQQKQQEEQCSFLRDRLEQLEGERDTYASQLQHLQSVLETCRRYALC